MQKRNVLSGGREEGGDRSQRPYETAAAITVLVVTCSSMEYSRDMFTRRSFLATGVVTGGVAMMSMPRLLSAHFAPTTMTNTPDSLKSEIDAQLAEIVRDPVCPLASLSALAVKDGRVVYDYQAGRRFIDDSEPGRDRPVNHETLFRIASISKLMVTIGVMKLVEEGKLSLDADVSQYLGFQLRNPHFADRPITLRMMLSHTSSMRDDAGYNFDLKKRLTLRDVLVPGGKGYGSGKMWDKIAAPGVFFQYANLPWGVIGTVMEAVTGERFDHVMNRLVLEPMKLVGGFSPIDLPKSVVDNIATLYRKRSADDAEIWNTTGPWVPQVDDFVNTPPAPRVPENYTPGTNGTLLGPQGNCRLTARGLARVMLMFFGDGELEGTRILRAESIKAMLSQQWQSNGKNGNAGGEEVVDGLDQVANSWGLGVQHILDISGPNHGDRIVEPGNYKPSGHFGEAYGLTSALFFDRSQKSGLIYIVGGVGADPTIIPGHYSAQFRYEERILTALYRAIA